MTHRLRSSKDNSAAIVGSTARDPARPLSAVAAGDWQARIADAVRRELDAAPEGGESSSG